jgi:hypothetical protein
MPQTLIEWIMLVIIIITSLLTIAGVGFMVWLIIHLVNSPAMQQMLGY